MLIKIQLFVYFNRNLSLELRQILRFTDYKYDNTTRCVDNTSRIIKIGFVCIQNVSDVVISVIRNINDFVYHQNHLRPRSHGIRRCSAAAPRRVCRPMYLPDNQHQKKIFQYLIMHMSALDMLCFLQPFFNFIKRFNTDFSNLRQIIGVKRSQEITGK